MHKQYVFLITISLYDALVALGIVKILTPHNKATEPLETLLKGTNWLVMSSCFFTHEKQMSEIAQRKNYIAHNKSPNSIGISF
jgi:hypothetical protein